MNALSERLAQFAVFATVLGVIAWASPLPDRVTDRDVYETTARFGIVADCSDIHCFRVLVPWTLGLLPGTSPDSSTFKWKVYAALCNAGAAVAVFVLCGAFGMSRRARWFASCISLVGFGSLYTLHDPYTSDPLMFLLGPVIANELLNGRVALGGALGMVGVFAKEFAAAPLYIVAGYEALEGRWIPAVRAFAAGNAAFIVWALLTLTLMLRFNYAWGATTTSVNFSGGAVLRVWLQRQSMRGVLSAMFNEFGALYVLMPVGVFLAPRPLRRMLLVSLPVAAIFAYVEQPDRALWNFHFVFVPLAAMVLERAPRVLAWSTVAAFGAGNLRVGAQLPMPTVGRGALVASVLLAGASTIAALWASSAITPIGGRSNQRAPA